MLDLHSLQRLRLSSRPWVQRLVADTLLRYNFEHDPGVQIRVEGAEHLPDEPSILAMNHTDRFNCMPLQYWLHRRGLRYTATWAKGKYYEHPVTAFLLETTNNIPTLSKGYLISKDFLATLGRLPTDREYEVLRAWLDDKLPGAEAEPWLPKPLLTRPRDMMGRPFEPSREGYDDAIRDLYRQMMRAFVALNEQAFGLGLDVIIFPEGTRSSRLSRGHIGLAQLALTTRRPVVPIACNGSDKLYPGSSPKARAGTVTYRIAPALRHEAWPELHLPPDFIPFEPSHEERHRATLQALVDRVMGQINDLLDPGYRATSNHHSDGVQGTRRFL